MNCPLDYSLCNKTVTVYRYENGQVQRRVIRNAFFQWQLQQSYDTFGKQLKTAFLLILPGKEESVYPGDRIVGGTGPVITAGQWQDFIPEKYTGLAEVSYVKPCYWDGEICHYEAGRK